MAARSVFKLLSKTCSYSLNSPQCSSGYSSFSPERCYKEPLKPGPQPRKEIWSARERFQQLRKISKSYEHFREYRIKEPNLDPPSNRLNAFPEVTDLAFRNPAKEFKTEVEIDDKNEEGNPIYELTETSRSEHFFDVLTFMKNQERTKNRKLFMHLQPCSIRPYGSNDNIHFPETGRRSFKIVFPVATAERTQNQQVEKAKSGTDIPKEPEENRKLTLSDPRSRVHRMSYSTISRKQRTSSAPELSITRKSSSANVKKQKGQTKICSEYVTIKLSELKEQCRKEKKCKAKKITFGRLPKLPPPDCPCVEELPLKEGKPLLRLKKLYEPKPKEKICVDIKECVTERADANYRIKKKRLPAIHPQDCPCEERELTDLVIKRLPKKRIPEPARPVPCPPTTEHCPPRADADLRVQQKSLPKLEPSDCPCIETESYKDVPLKRLVAKPVQEPPKKVCKVEVCDETVRADHDLKPQPKVLPQLTGDCPCPEPPKMLDAPRIPRLPKMRIPDKPRESCEEEICDETIRSDHDLKVECKKLPVFVPQNCPCIEQELPSVSVALKRLVPKPVKEPERICVEEVVCAERADDGLKVKPKQLPKLQLKECKCVETVMKDAPPLKRLVPAPVREPVRVCKVEEVCVVPRADENLKVKQKTLPMLPGGDCPCIEPPRPIDVKPLARLKKKKVIQKRVCPPETVICIASRADDGLKIKPRKLPKLQINDCPCIEETPPVDVPLARLKKVRVPEPPKICEEVDECLAATAPRSDENDWMYWKRVEVNCTEPTTGKRNFSTFSRRQYSTCKPLEQDLFPIKPNLPPPPKNQVDNCASDIIIDIKPSTPLVLTQKPLDLTEIDDIFVTKKPVDCVSIVICKNNNFGSSSRFISTCSSLEKLKNHVTPPCECPPTDQYLQPSSRMFEERERFIEPFPEAEEIAAVAKKSRRYCRTRIGLEEPVQGDSEECSVKEEVAMGQEEEEEPAEYTDPVKEVGQKLSLLERIVNYFRARPDCPSPEEFKRMRLKEQAEKAASRAGLCLYDPKEMMKRNEDLPKVITPGSLKGPFDK